LVVTSKREGLPTLVLEAMAQKKPIVVPNEAGSMEAIGDGDFGFIYRQGNLDELADCTLKALADTQKCQNARQRILSEYDWRVTAPKLDAIYNADPILCLPKRTTAESL
jgi:glycosyltransferase involved in cell wall biosynthesis